MRGGVRQLRHLVVNFSLKDGSSLGTRSWVAAKLDAWKTANPDVAISVHRTAGHPVLRAHYRPRGSEPITRSLRNASEAEVQDAVDTMANRTAEKAPSAAGDRVQTDRASVQGMWNPYLRIE